MKLVIFHELAENTYVVEGGDNHYSLRIPFDTEEAARKYCESRMRRRSVAEYEVPECNDV